MRHLEGIMKSTGTAAALSKRLQTIASFVTVGNTVADIGCDHGFVPIYLVGQTISPRAIAMDIKTGPLQKAKEHIREYGLEDQIETRLSNGMAQLNPGEVDSVILSGIGGPLMIQILENGQEVTASLKELILSPQSEIETVRRYLLAHSFLIPEEKMVLEDGKYYVIMHVIPKRDGIVSQNKEDWTELEYRYGKSLLEKREETFLSYLEWEINTKRQLLDLLQKTDTERAIQRRKTMHYELTMAECARNQVKKSQ